MHTCELLGAQPAPSTYKLSRQLIHTWFSLMCVSVTWMKQTFEEADKNGDGFLNIEEIYQLLHKLNVNLPRRKVKQMFQVSLKRKVMVWNAPSHITNICNKLLLHSFCRL